MPASPGAEGDVGRWLALLRDGTQDEQQRARTELGLILEARGLLDDAFEAYARNVAEGVSDPRPYERLAVLARARGDHATVARVQRALADLLAPSPPAPASPALTPDQGETGAPAAGEAPGATASAEESDATEL